MTDEQILNALRSCGDGIAICDDCVYYGKAHCSILAKKDIIARFEELLAENAELKARLERIEQKPRRTYERKIDPTNIPKHLHHRVWLILNDINSVFFSDEDKAYCIRLMLDLPTHNGITKDLILQWCDWLWTHSFRMEPKEKKDES